MERLKAYYQLAKPGIIYGNAISAIAGFAYASKFHFNFVQFISFMLGLSLVIACGCVINNLTDRRIDIHMTRTKTRALVTGMIKPVPALVYGIILGILGFYLLVVHVNALVVWIGVVGLIDYTLLYAYSKRHWTSSTLIGSISGATPILAGYCAFTGRLDIDAWLLFLVMVVWQMPHFYAIALFRRDEYKRAGIPLLSIKKSYKRVITSILAYSVLFFACNILLAVFGKAGYAYALVISALSIWWIMYGLKGFKAPDHIKWARTMFFKSLLVLLVFSALVSVARLVP